VVYSLTDPLIVALGDHTLIGQEFRVHSICVLNLETLDIKNEFIGVYGFLEETCSELSDAVEEAT
jgi:hypothetical protein